MSTRSTTLVIVFPVPQEQDDDFAERRDDVAYGHSAQDVSRRCHTTVTVTIGAQPHPVVPQVAHRPRGSYGHEARRSRTRGCRRRKVPPHRVPT